jgi:hypothetical protein
MNSETISPLRRRIIEGMTVRKFVEKTQKDYIGHVNCLTISSADRPTPVPTESPIRARVQKRMGIDCQGLIDAL